MVGFCVGVLVGSMVGLKFGAAVVGILVTGAAVGLDVGTRAERGTPVHLPDTAPTNGAAFPAAFVFKKQLPPRYVATEQWGCSLH